jgi:hypothetical protein
MPVFLGFLSLFQGFLPFLKLSLAKKPKNTSNNPFYARKTAKYLFSDR